jgi:asparagine synthase (glutamine-hydrolysing)
VEETFLYRADRMGMANSIEIRVPFLDQRVVEYAMQMPQELKYRGGQPKYILKKSLEPVVPHEFLYRPKQGFCVPVGEWAGGMMHEKIVEVLPRIERDWGAVTSEFTNALVDHVRTSNPTSDQGFLSWNLYSLATWYQRWFA